MSQKLTLEQESVFSAKFTVEAAGEYTFRIQYSASEKRNLYGVTLDRECLSSVTLEKGLHQERALVTLPLSEGEHTLRLEKREGDGSISGLWLEKAVVKAPAAPVTALSDPQASANARKLMEYLGSIYGKKVIMGQHTKDIPMQEIAFIEQATGKKPALCGFELLGYSPNVQWETSDAETVEEARNNLDTIKMAVDWAENQHGLVAYCWHWFSPMQGNNKAFYTWNTEFDAAKAVTPGTPEYEATVRDIDFMAEKLKVFAEKDIPILWRPLHEAEGGWFWWGAKGAEPCKALWRLLYDRFTRVHGLHNLIWVWNSLSPEWFPGEDCVDIVAADLYTTPGNYGSCKCDFEYADRVSAQNRMVALSECGVNPDPERAIEAGAPWLWEMTWCGGFCTDGAWNSVQQYKKAYDSAYSVTLSDLPKIF